ncbi:MAG: hypothetical protein MNPFHGCM_00912 [Gemmatimonadaceae bacterium]|nr:hypothetical protein [Gemmatimonadaceae bacterium]
MKSSSSPASSILRVIVLGNDAQVAARPADVVQLSRACLAYGFAFVAPASWGDELIAARAAHFSRDESTAAILLAHCPRVQALVAAAGADDFQTLRSVSPPVATARYLRASFHPATLHITYAGACPGALSDDIDERLLPEMLLARLVGSGCDPARQPPHFDDMIPADRRRFASVPGGVPSASFLSLMTRTAHVHAVAPETLTTVARHCDPDESCLLDLGSAAGCHCAVDPRVMQRLEPARATGHVVNLNVMVDLAAVPAEMADTAPRIVDAPEPPVASAATQADTRSSPETPPEEPERLGVARPAASQDNAATSSNPPIAPTAGHRARPGTPPGLPPVQRAALAITGSAVTMLWSQRLQPAEARAGHLVPPATSPAAAVAPRRPSVAPIPAPVPAPASVAAPSPRQFIRRHVRFARSRDEDTTARLLKRLPCRSTGGLVTARPPDATSMNR